MEEAYRSKGLVYEICIFCESPALGIFAFGLRREISMRSDLVGGAAPTVARIGKWIKTNVLLLVKKKKQTIWQR